MKFAHTSSGMRRKGIPGARTGDDRDQEVERGRIDDAPAHWTPMLKNTWPNGCSDASGA